MSLLSGPNVKDWLPNACWTGPKQVSRGISEVKKRGEQMVVGDDEFIFVLEPHRAVSLGVGEHVQRIE